MIVGRVIDWYRKLNPIGVPALLFAPDMASSNWFAQQFNAVGIKAASIDGEKCWVDGMYYSGDKKRDEIIERLRCRDIKVVCNRFVLTAGVDIPEVGHGICATPFGSVTVFRQAFGRISRPHPSLNSVVWADHGGNVERLGDPQVDLDWYQTPTDTSIQDTIKITCQNNPSLEPICCPNCHKFRMPTPGGDNKRCPDCGYFSPVRVHYVLQKNGDLVKRTGPYFPKKKIAADNLEEKWKACYYRWKKKNGSFAQAIALFKYENGCLPQPNWPLMPKRIVDRRRKIKDVEKEYLWS
jgi:superfamily II DNA or RNA helicase